MIWKCVEKNPRIFSAVICDRSFCREVCETLFNLEHLWRSASGQELFTIGSPVYQNKDNLSYYLILAQQDRGYLWRHFSELYLIVIFYLENFLDARVVFHPSVALPGFHILHVENDYAGGGFHFDLSHECLNIQEYPRYTDWANVSFTLSLSVPTTGAGLHVSKVRYEEILQGRKPTKLEIESDLLYVPYTEGGLVLSSGFAMHQMAPIRGSGRSEYRITLQGHCIRQNNEYVVFW